MKSAATLDHVKNRQVEETKRIPPITVSTKTKKHFERNNESTNGKKNKDPSTVRRPLDFHIKVILSVGKRSMIETMKIIR